jgi:hypothetical protein
VLGSVAKRPQVAPARRIGAPLGRSACARPCESLLELLEGEGLAQTGIDQRPVEERERVPFVEVGGREDPQGLGLLAAKLFHELDGLAARDVGRVDEGDVEGLGQSRTCLVERRGDREAGGVVEKAFEGAREAGLVDDEELHGDAGRVRVVIRS